MEFEMVSPLCILNEVISAVENNEVAAVSVVIVGKDQTSVHESYVSDDNSKRLLVAQTARLLEELLHQTQPTNALQN